MVLLMKGFVVFYRSLAIFECHCYIGKFEATTNYFRTIAAKNFREICSQINKASKNKDKLALDRHYGDFLVEAKRMKIQIARLTD